MRRQTMAVFQIHEKDNVAVAVSPVAKGETVTVGAKTFTVLADIPAGHKIAVVPIAKGQDVVKYGFPIGTAKEDIPAGAWVHTHNVQSKLGDDQLNTQKVLSGLVHNPTAGDVLVLSLGCENNQVDLMKEVIGE